MLRTLVIGLGNPILGDDGVGWKVAEAMGPRLAADPPRAQAVEVDYAALGGLSLMERLVGYDRAVIVDAVVTRRPVGTVARYRLDDFPERGGANLTAVHVVGIEAERLCDFSEALTPAVAAAVPQAVGAVWDALHSFSEED
jgi:hydrogenase maturation protease